MTLIQKHDKLQKMIKRQTKHISIKKGTCVEIRYALLFQITFLQTLASEKTHLRFCISY